MVYQNTVTSSDDLPLKRFQTTTIPAPSQGKDVKKIRLLVKMRPPPRRYSSTGQTMSTSPSVAVERHHQLIARHHLEPHLDQSPEALCMQGPLQRDFPASPLPVVGTCLDYNVEADHLSQLPNNNNDIPKLVTMTSKYRALTI